MTSFLISFDSPEATLESAGGKGSNLVRLSRAGFAVPRGFIISTAAYRDFVIQNGLQPMIALILDDLIADNPSAIEQASATIRSAFSLAKISTQLEQAVLSACSEYNRVPVAVRSSATAEDLPDLSFAGQQDTFLNIIGEQNLLKAVVDCWSSLWTARAIGYRQRNGVPHLNAALAVVIQEMVQSDVSGVLFTANPLSGLLSESVIDATFGLGEALVSGQVEPDHYTVNSLNGKIIERTLGSKQISTRSKTDGGVENIVENAATRQSLTDDQIRQIVATGQAIQKEYGAPQDIEWALAGDRLYILQTRAITSLYPVPQVSFDPLIVWFAFGSVQGLVGPMTPLGLDTIHHVVAGAGRMFGRQLDPAKISVFAVAGERQWIKISDLIRNPVGSRIIIGLLGFLEPSVGQIVGLLIADPRLSAGSGKLKIDTLWRLARFALPVLVRLVRNMLQPATARARFDHEIESYLATAQIPQAEDRYQRLANTIAFMRERIANALAFLLPRFIPVFGPSMAGLNMLNHISSDPTLAIEVTRSLPNNVTTTMDLALWQTAQAVKADEASRVVFNENTAAGLAEQYLSQTLPPVAQTAIAGFLQKYGMRGVGEIDFGQPRWREEPAPIMHTLQSYLQIDPKYAPDVLFANGEKAALAAVETIARRVRQQPGGWFQEKLVRAAARRVRLLMGARESPKFFAIRTMGIARQALLEIGEEFVKAGTVERADDLVYLSMSELENPALDWKTIVTSRRAAYQRELRRRQVPRVLVSDGRAFYEGIGAQTDTAELITGSPVSPGVVEGLVHVVLDPRGTQLAPGEILVCPGTDPAWTPLFMAAGGLITEVGGMMTHGSVVAREYGIPAVVGVHQATLRLKTGQKIRVDGTNGKISVLNDSGSGAATAD